MSLKTDSSLLRKLFQIKLSKVLPTQKRYRYKKKWATNVKQKEATELALQHFDQFYAPVYGNLWPSIRISLLSPQKYCALVNNFHASPDTVVERLQHRGAYNFVTRLNSHTNQTKENKIVEGAPTTPEPSDTERSTVLENSSYHENPFPDMTFTDIPDEKWQIDGDAIESENQGNSDVLQDQTDADSPSLTQDLYGAFIPAQKIYSERQILREQEVMQSVYEPHDIKVQVTQGSARRIPQHLKVLVHPQGDVSDFTTPKADSTGLLEYYLMDAASVLPVIALDPHPSDSILDMCAAPGGKTLAMLQTLTSGDILANDTSGSRLQRLETILHWYCPQAKTQLQKSQRNGRMFDSPIFDKVLVDVPCTTDRHVLVAEENNLFKPGRITDRLKMTTTQKELLLAGIKSCKAGGCVVYSTCSLALTQNDGVIQAAVEDLWNNTQIDVAVEDISWMSSAFSNTFRFYHKCRFGQLVLPTLRANFGPMYICKIRRLT